MHFSPEPFSVKRALSVFLFEAGRAGIGLVGGAVLMEYLLPGSVLSSIPLFPLIFVVVLLNLCTSKQDSL